jgi:flagellar biosynthesis/type III secretory pathway protein FliH
VLRNVAVAGRAPLEGAAEAVMVGESPTTAYDRGFADGITAARREASETIDRVAAGVHHALEGVRAHLADLRRVQAEALVGTAMDAAEAILGAAPPIDAGMLTERIRRALSAIDDGPLTVFLSADDREVLGEAIGARFDVEIAEDPALGPGEARVRGPWAQADLTRATALGAVREAIT